MSKSWCHPTNVLVMAGSQESAEMSKRPMSMSTMLPLSLPCWKKCRRLLDILHQNVASNFTHHTTVHIQVCKKSCPHVSMHFNQLSILSTVTVASAMATCKVAQEKCISSMIHAKCQGHCRQTPGFREQAEYGQL